jgi:protein-disulfide isomerase
MENNTKNKLSTPAAIVVAGFLIMVGILVTRFPAQKEKVADVKSDTAKAGEVALLPVSNNEHVRGDLEKAKVLIVEFSDTECPWCQRFHPSLKEAMEKYPGQIAWVYRHSPIDSLHSKARNESRATECVAQLKGNDAFWGYLDMIYEKTPANDGLNPDLLATYAEEFGISKSTFDKCMVDNKVAFDALIDASIQDGKNAGLQGTPHSIIVTRDGTKYPISGADVEELNSTLEKLLK